MIWAVVGIERSEGIDDSPCLLPGQGFDRRPAVRGCGKLAPVDHVADRLGVELENRGDVGHGEQLIWHPVSLFRPSRLTGLSQRPLHGYQRSAAGLRARHRVRRLGRLERRARGRPRAGKRENM